MIDRTVILFIAAILGREEILALNRLQVAGELWTHRYDLFGQWLQLCSGIFFCLLRLGKSKLGKAVIYCHTFLVSTSWISR